MAAASPAQLINALSFRSLAIVFTLLVGYAAGSLAGALAAGLAFAAATLLGAFTKIAGLQRFDSFHFRILPSLFSTEKSAHSHVRYYHQTP